MVEHVFGKDGVRGSIPRIGLRTMFRFRKKNLILFLFLLILLIIIFYWQNIKEIIGPISEEFERPEAGETEEGVSPPEEEIKPEATKETEAVEKKSEFSREEFMTYVSKNISTLSPEKPVLGGRWGVIRFWFTKDGVAYAEYEDGHILRQILVEAKEGSEGKTNYKVLGYFEPGINEWILKDGNDPHFGKLRELYEWDDIDKVWRKR